MPPTQQRTFAHVILNPTVGDQDEIARLADIVL